jgi:hypothetical protein
MPATVGQFLGDLEAQKRVLVIGGVAVIAHGLPRPTRDADVWLEPCWDEAEWTSVLIQVMNHFPGVRGHDLREHREVDPGEIEATVGRDGVVRLVGLERPLDVFRIPHNLKASDFDEVWRLSTLVIAEGRVMEEISLLLTKKETSRPQDIADVVFLESKVRAEFSRRLKECTAAEAKALLARYADHETCRALLDNPHEEARQLALQLLREFADEGDPFAVEILKHQVQNEKI